MMTQKGHDGIMASGKYQKTYTNPGESQKLSMRKSEKFTELV